MAALSESLAFRPWSSFVGGLVFSSVVVVGSRLVVRAGGPSSFDIVSELTLSAAGPCAPRGHVPPGHEAAHRTQGSLLLFLFLFLGFYLCECVCCEALSSEVIIE